LAGVERVWRERADAMLVVSDQMWAVGKAQEALNEVVRFAELAAHAYERVGRTTDFGRFATARIQDIAGNAVLTTAVVSHISAGVGEDMDVMALLRVCQRLGVNL
jgi:hypothetical protein